MYIANLSFNYVMCKFVYLHLKTFCMLYLIPSHPIISLVKQFSVVFACCFTLYRL